MIICFRNFFRNKMVNLTTLTIKHFIPDAKFYCVSFYKQYKEEYEDQEPLLEFIDNTFVKTAYVNKNDKPLDHIDSTKTSGFENADNVKYFTEGFNTIYNLFKDVDAPVLMLAEDHFFTTGATLKEISEANFDVAYAPWDHNYDANGAILSVNFAKTGHLFPLPETGPSIERHLSEHLISKVSNLHRISTRKHINYFGDGKYTNSSVEMEELIRQAGII